MLGYAIVISRSDGARAFIAEAPTARLHGARRKAHGARRLLSPTLFDAGFPRLLDMIAARISQIVRSFQDRCVGDHSLCGWFGLAV